jgi:hypothetical protein
LFYFAVLPEWSHVANGPVVLGLVQGFWRFKSQSDGFVHGSEQKAAIHNRIVGLQNMPIEQGIKKLKKQRDKTQ